MIKLRYKLGLFNAVSKVVFGIIFIGLMPLILERINTIQTDNELIEKREQVIDLIYDWGVDILLSENDQGSFGSYNILKEEYINLERLEIENDWNFIEVTQRIIDEEIIDYRVLNYSFMIDGETYLLEIGKSLSSIRQSEENIKRYTLFFLLIFIILSFISDFSFASRLIRPLENITRKLKSTISPSLFNHDSIHTNTAEFAYLNQAISELMSKINTLFQQEKQTTANISHELLTPVSILRSKLENLISRDDINEETAIKIEESLKTIYRLKTMVNSLMLIARIESHQYLKDERFPVTSVMESIFTELSPLWEDKEIKVYPNFQEEIILEKANKSLIFTMLYNVLKNAIKFTPLQGEIHISTGLHGSNHYLSIKDSGNGMNNQQLKNLFLRFKKTSGPEENSNGIGLAISKSIADFHQIQIAVNTQIGKGCEMIFYF
jgi:signal transduction histidine kinase